MREQTIELVRDWLLANQARVNQLTRDELRETIGAAVDRFVGNTVLNAALRGAGIKRRQPRVVWVDGVAHYTTDEVARRTGYSRSYLCTLRQIGQLQAVRVRHTLYWDLDHVRSVMERR